MQEFQAGQFDIAVVGAGHAGIEAALAAARLGMKFPGGPSGVKSIINSLFAKRTKKRTKTHGSYPEN